MLILIEDTERGFDVAKGIWGAFNSCLYIEDNAMEAYSADYIIDQCAKSGVALIIVTKDMDEFKDGNPQAFCFYCDGGIINAATITMAFDKQTPRDKIVQSIITYFKRKKLL